MTLQMHYQEKYEQGYDAGMEQGVEQGIEQEKNSVAKNMLLDGEFPIEKIALYSGLTIEQVLELKKELQLN